MDAHRSLLEFVHALVGDEDARHAFLTDGHDALDAAGWSALPPELLREALVHAADALPHELAGALDGIDLDDPLDALARLASGPTFETPEAPALAADVEEVDAATLGFGTGAFEDVADAPDAAGDDDAFDGADEWADPLAPAHDALDSFDDAAELPDDDHQPVAGSTEDDLDDLFDAPLDED